jgi:hypothetical protein
MGGWDELIRVLSASFCQQQGYSSVKWVESVDAFSAAVFIGEIGGCILGSSIHL